MRYYVGKIPFGNDLCHFGIKGMRWGIRRYENEDGTLTEEGKERYRREEERNKKRRESILNNPRKLAAHYDEFSQEEINAAMKKAQQKQQLIDISKKKIRNGKEVADSIFSYGKLAGLAIGLLGAGVATYKIATAGGAIKSVGDIVAAGQLLVEKIGYVMAPVLKI